MLDPFASIMGALPQNLTAEDVRYLSLFAAMDATRPRLSKSAYRVLILYGMQQQRGHVAVSLRDLRHQTGLNTSQVVRGKRELEAAKLIRRQPGTTGHPDHIVVPLLCPRRLAMDNDPGYVYILVAPSGHYKIGKSRQPDTRQQRLATQLPFPVERWRLIPTRQMARFERHLHVRFAHKRTNGEWFTLSDADLALIHTLASIEPAP